jgi:hypothetical protein
MAAEMASPHRRAPSGCPAGPSSSALPSGFGEATSLALARAGLNIFGVHLDRRADLAQCGAHRREIRAMGREAHSST